MAVLTSVAAVSLGPLPTAAAPKPTSNVWKSVASMTTPRFGAAAATGLDGRIYVFGGSYQSKILDSAEVYDPNTNSWTSIAPMPHPPAPGDKNVPDPIYQSGARTLAAAATASDGRIYVFGGYVSGCNQNQLKDCHTLDRVQAYNPKDNNWANMSPMGIARWGLGGAASKDKNTLYAIGGGGVFVEAYTPCTEQRKTNCDVWNHVAPMSTSRQYLGAATGGDGRIYAVGGLSGGLNAVRTVEAHDPKTGTWAPAPPMSRNRYRLAAAAGTDGRIYAIGGYDDTPESKQRDLKLVEAYTPGSLSWTRVADTLTGRTGLAAAGAPQGRTYRIYAIGGGNDTAYPDPTYPEPTYLNSVEAYRP